MFFDHPAQVSFSREVAPILALHCHGCHGGAGGLTTRTYQDLMRGGNSGRVIVAGYPGRSVLLHFVDGARGEVQRMPLGGRPLTEPQLDLLRRWIAAGASWDSAVRPIRRELRNITVPKGKVLRVSYKVNEQAWVTMKVIDPENLKELFSDGVSIKTPKEQGDGGEPGDALFWELRSGDGWPPSVTIQMEVHYTSALPTIEFSAALL